MIQSYKDEIGISTGKCRKLSDLISELDNIVQECAEGAYNIPALDSGSSHQAKWQEKARSVYIDGQGEDFLYADYGYAVEDMVNRQIRTRFYTMKKGNYRIKLQVTHGHTRPDIVIEETQGWNTKEVAWLDITSENSEGHIYSKSGAGWQNTPYVAELLYPAFDADRLTLSSEPGMGIRAKALAASRAGSSHESQLEEHMAAVLRKVFAKFMRKYPGTKREVADAIQAELGVSFPDKKRHPPIKSMLLEFERLYPNDMYYTLVAQSLLRDFYRGGRQNQRLAMEYIEDSLALKKSTESIYLKGEELDSFLDDMSEDFW